jgi:hypothetical protein
VHEGCQLLMNDELIAATHLVLRLQTSKLIKDTKRTTWRMFEGFRAEVEATLLEAHETRRGKESSAVK